MWTLALVSAAASIPACAALQKHAPPAAQTGPVRVELENVDDMMFTASVPTSGETVRPIMDTGSFELVLFEKNCRGCSDSSAYFDAGTSGNDYQDGKVEATQAYGSGQTISRAVTASAVMEDEVNNEIQVKNQMFWLAAEVDMEFAVEDTVGGIFGLGPPASALTFAEDNLRYEQERLKYRHEFFDSTLTGLKKVVQLERGTEPWLLGSRVSMFSLCVMPGFGANGVLVYNDIVPSSNRWVQTNGVFWQVPMMNISIGSLSYNASSDCSAIMDSGTTLIGVPADFLKELTPMIEELIEKLGCDDLSAWPSFLFSLGNQTMSLHASSYLASYDMYSLQESDEGMPDAKRSKRARRARRAAKHRMPHLDRFLALHKRRLALAAGSSRTSRTSVCAPALFAMEPDPYSGNGHECQFLFGLPIFREYYTTHKPNSTGHAEAMLFSKADAECFLTSNTDLQARHQPRSPLLVHADKIRFPDRKSVV